MKCIGWRHLQQHNTTVDIYKQQFPQSPLRSEASTARKSKSAKLANASRKGVARSDVVKTKISQANKGKDAWNKGIGMSDTQKQTLSQTKKDQYANGSTIHWNTGNITPNDVKKKISETALSQCRTYSEPSKQKRQSTMQQKYDDGWVHPSHRPEVLQQRKKTMFERYGVDNFMQQHINHSVLLKLNDRTWLEDQHITQHKPITQICKDLGLHWKNSNAMVKSRLLKFDIPQQYDFSCSYPERELRDLLTEWNIPFIGNDRTQIKPKELDIYIPSKSIAIEYCGLIWHSDAFVDKNYHKLKMELCAAVGIKLITIFEDEWLHCRDIVISKLQQILGISNDQRIFARNCSVIEIEHQTAKEFLNTNHIQGYGPSSINLGLHYNSELVAVAAYKRDGSSDFILNRFATSCSVIGGFTKLERYFDRNYHPTMVSTFADMRWSIGDLYKNTGYTLVNLLRPDYAYIDKSSFTRIHKFNFRHHNLHNMLDVYDPLLSETENTRANGIHRIYNCGLMKFQRTNMSE